MPSMPSVPSVPQADAGLERAAAADERITHKWLHGLTCNAGMPGAVLERLLACDALPGSGRWLAMRRLDAEATAIVVASPYVRHRLDVAENPTADPDVLMRLAYDAEPRVRLVYTVMVGEFKRRIPAKLLEMLARDPDPKVRRAVLWYQPLPPAVQDRLVEDEDPQVRAAALNRPLWERLAQPVRERLLDDPAEQVRAKLAELLRPREEPEVLAAELRVAHPEAHVRCEAAGDLDVPFTLALRLAHDPENAVRLALSMREDLTEEQRASIRYDVPDWFTWPAWMAQKAADPDTARRISVSAHAGLRRALARQPHLPDDVARRLAEDEDPLVRRHLCASQDAPHEVLLEAYVADERSTAFLLNHRNFAKPGLARFVDDPDPRLRMAALHDPEAGPELPLRLADDPEVGCWALRDPRFPAGELLRRLTRMDSAFGAAANPTLPHAVMHRLIDLSQGAAPAGKGA